MLEGVRGDRRQAILAEIEALGPVLAGCIIERSTRCQTEGCHCRADPPQLHGPYPTWSIAKTAGRRAKLRPTSSCLRRWPRQQT